MAKVSSEGYRVVVEPDGAIRLNEPTNAQFRLYRQRQFQTGKRGQKPQNRMFEAQVWLFDEIYSGHENLEDNEGEIQDGEISRIPDRLKADAIAEIFERETVSLEE